MILMGNEAEMNVGIIKEATTADHKRLVKTVNLLNYINIFNLHLANGIKHHHNYTDIKIIYNLKCLYKKYFINRSVLDQLCKLIIDITKYKCDYIITWLDDYSPKTFKENEYFSHNTVYIHLNEVDKINFTINTFAKEYNDRTFYKVLNKGTINLNHHIDPSFKELFDCKVLAPLKLDDMYLDTEYPLQFHNKNMNCDDNTYISYNNQYKYAYRNTNDSEAYMNDYDNLYDNTIGYFTDSRDPAGDKILQEEVWNFAIELDDRIVYISSYQHTMRDSWCSEPFTNELLEEIIIRVKEIREAIDRGDK